MDERMKSVSGSFTAPSCSPLVSRQAGPSRALIVSAENLQMGGPSLWDSPMANGFPGPASPAGRDAKVCNPGFSMIRLNRSKIVICVDKGDGRKPSLPTPCHHFGQATGMDPSHRGWDVSISGRASMHTSDDVCVQRSWPRGASDSALLLLFGL